MSIKEGSERETGKFAPHTGMWYCGEICEYEYRYITFAGEHGLKNWMKQNWAKKY